MQVRAECNDKFVISSGGCWLNATTMNLPLPSYFLPLIINQSSMPECGSREVMFIVSPFDTNQTKGSLARLCAPKYLVAYNVNTVISATPTRYLVNIDEEGFN